MKKQIDKLEPFYTEQDVRELQELRAASDSALFAIQDLGKRMEKARQDGDQEELKALQEESRSLLLGPYDEAEKAISEILISAEGRYIRSFAGNPSRILEDVREIVSAVEREDYIRWQRRVTEELKPILEDAPDKDGAKDKKRMYQEAKKLSVQGFVNCRRFILRQLRQQLNVIAHYQEKDLEEAALAIVEEKAASLYKKPKSAPPATLQQERDLITPDLQSGDIHGALLTQPTSSVINVIGELLFAGDPARLQDAKRRFNRHAVYEAYEDERRWRLCYATERESAIIEIDKFNGGPKAKKIFNRILLRATEQAMDNGRLFQKHVSFPLRDLVGDGQYRNIETARQGFLNMRHALTSMKISGKSVKGNRRVVCDDLTVLFTRARVKNATCEVTMNEELNWGYIFQYYTILPDFYFELPDRAAELLEYIFFLARQHTREIEETGSFTIGYRALQARLGLPDEEKTKNPGRDIKEAIEDAIRQIEQKYRKYADPLPVDGARKEDAQELVLVRSTMDKKTPIKKYLDEGRLKISLKGRYAKRFIDVSKGTAKQIETAKKRKERIQEKAAAMRLAEQN